MNLLKVVEQLDYDDKEIIERIRCCIEDRSEWLEDREPEYDGEVYDLWEEKYDELNNILDLFEEYEDEEDTENKRKIIKEICDNIKEYHYSYGGLSRLKI